MFTYIRVVLREAARRWQ